MKKFIFLLGAVSMLIVSCSKSPDFAELSGQFTVQTGYKDGQTFKGTFGKVYIADSIILIASTTDSIWRSADSAQIKAKFRENLTNDGYSIVSTAAQADLVLQLSVGLNVNIVAGYYWWDYYWWGYNPCYWWGYGPWCGYVPYYPVVYTYEDGSLMGELINIKNTTGGTAKTVWSTYIGGVLQGTSYDLKNALQSIDQAFVQSPYLSVK